MIIHKSNNVTVFQSAVFQLNTTVVATEDLILVVDLDIFHTKLNKFVYMLIR